MRKDPIVISWDQFKTKITEHIRNDSGPRMCRGQSNSNWPLTTSYHRNPAGISLIQYFSMTAEIADIVGTFENRTIDVRDKEVNGSFLAYLQHHGFPTPLLDWSLSPYIAAYFAYSGVNQEKPETKHVSIFIFDFLKWQSRWKPIYDYTVKDPHVSIFKPKTMGNIRQFKQQGLYYTWTNIEKVDEHIWAHEVAAKEDYLVEYHLPANLKYNVISELDAMGISAFNLFGTIDSLCGYYKDMLFRSDNKGEFVLDKILKRLQVGRQ